MRWQGRDAFAEEDGDTGANREGHVTGAVSQQQAKNVLEMEELRKNRRKKKCKVTRSNDKYVVRARVIYKRKMKGGEVEQ